MGRIKSEARTTNDPYPRAPDKVETFTVLPPAADATRLVPQPAADEHPALAGKSMFGGVPVRRPTLERPARGSEADSEDDSAAASLVASSPAAKRVKVERTEPDDTNSVAMSYEQLYGV